MSNFCSPSTIFVCVSVCMNNDNNNHDNLSIYTLSYYTLAFYSFALRT